MLVVADELSPRWFGKHLLAMALHRNTNIRIVIVPKLKDMTKAILKVPAIIFAIRNSANVSRLEKFYQQLGIHPELLKHYCTIQKSFDVSINKKKIKKLEVDDPPVILLKKTSASSRSFIPMDIEESSTQTTQKIKLETSDDFISLSKFNSSTNFVSNLQAPLYRPIKIKKILGNPNRAKRNKKS